MGKDWEKGEGYNLPTPASSLAPEAAAKNTITAVKYIKNTQRGRANFMKNVPENRPTANAPCAPASIFEPVELDVPFRVSVA